METQHDLTRQAAGYENQVYSDEGEVTLIPATPRRQERIVQSEVTPDIDPAERVFRVITSDTFAWFDLDGLLRDEA